MVLFPVEGDGAYVPRTFAAWIFQDPTLGPYLARNINMHFVKYWDYWEDCFGFPFVRDIGIGKQKTCNNKEELFEFFLNSKDGAYMWRGHEDFSVVSNTYQFRIKIITVRGRQDENPSIEIIEPDPNFVRCSELPAGKVPEMIVLNEHNSHYDLIIPMIVG
jgi:hypothetical protein